MKTSPFAIGMSLLVLGSTACALLPGRRDADDLDEPVSREITVTIDNQNFYDATVYALRSGERRRIGQVGGNREGRFSFLWPHYDLRVEIYLLAIGSYFTSPVAVEPGDEVEITVIPNLHTYPPGSVW